MLVKLLGITLNMLWELFPGTNISHCKVFDPISFQIPRVQWSAVCSLEKQLLFLRTSAKKLLNHPNAWASTSETHLRKHVWKQTITSHTKANIYGIASQKLFTQQQNKKKLTKLKLSGCCCCMALWRIWYRSSASRFSCRWQGWFGPAFRGWVLGTCFLLNTHSVLRIFWK